MQVIAGAPHGGTALLRRRSGAAKGGGGLRRADPFRPGIGITEGGRRLSAAGTKKEGHPIGCPSFLVDDTGLEPVTPCTSNELRTFLQLFLRFIVSFSTLCLLFVTV